MRYIIIPLILLVVQLTPVFAQDIGDSETRDLYFMRLLSEEPDIKIDTVSYILLLSEPIEGYKGRKLMPLLSYLKLPYRYQFITGNGYDPSGITGIEIMYHPRVVVSILFQLPFSTRIQENGEFVRWFTEEEEISLALEQKIKSIDIKTWDYEQKYFSDKIIPKPVQSDGVTLNISKAEIIDNHLSIDLKLANPSSSPIIIYKPTLESMMYGILSVGLIEQRKRERHYDLYPFDAIYDIDKIYLTEGNTVLLNKGEVYETNIKIPLTDLKAKGKFKLRVALNYANTHFEFEDFPFSENVLKDVLRTEVNVKL